jgi:NADH-quinone oxidoreductase subunit F
VKHGPASMRETSAARSRVRRLSKFDQLAFLRQALRTRAGLNEIVVRVCATGCRAFGSLNLITALRSEVHKRGLGALVEVRPTGCQWLCARPPVVSIDPMGIVYFGVTVDDVDDLIGQTLVRGKPLERLCYRDPTTDALCSEREQIPFFNQEDVVLTNCGIIDPTDINQYVQRNGYNALETVLSSMTPETVIDFVKRSGLRGRGSAGFPTGLKWEQTREERRVPKYVICNTDQGDPAGFLDRAILEGDPHSVLEGMIIAGYAVGATRGYICCRAEYPIALEHLSMAVGQARQLGLIGENILGLPFTFDIEIIAGAGSFVCSQDTAMIASLEGRRAVPRPSPPYPSETGLGGQPTTINNVETLANIRHIILMGHERFAQTGTRRSKGTKVFSLSGQVVNSGLVEVTFGTTLRKMIYEIGGGIARGRRLKAVQMGGALGGCVAERHLDIPVGYGALDSVGATMGSGGMVVLDERTCMVELARTFMAFAAEESCGKCAPCRQGTRQMLEILTRLCRGEGREGDVDLLERIGKVVSSSALCGLGQNAPRTVLSTISHFREEYDEHVRDRRCRSGVCDRLIVSACRHTCPAGVDVPRFLAHISAGRYAEAGEVVRESHPFPAVCGRICRHPCETHCRRGDLEDPLALRLLMRFASDRCMENEPAGAGPFAVTRKERVAVVGGGPAGLTCAYHLARLGYAATVFEAKAEAGGMLTAVVPAFRLPPEILAREIEAVVRAGVELRTGSPISSDHTLEHLRRDGFAAVFIAAGARGSQRLGVPGEDTRDGLLYGLDFLRDARRGPAPALGDRIVVIGGGDTSVDAARTARRLRPGASISIVCLESGGEMPALGSSVEQALAEDIRLLPGLGVRRIVEAGGRVQGVATQILDRIFDTGGRYDPAYLSGTEEIMSCDTVIVAARETPDESFMPAQSRLQRERWEALVVDRKRLTTNVPWIFAGGGFVTGAASVVDAIAAGARAARSIDGFLRGRAASGPVGLEDKRPAGAASDPVEPSDAPRAKARLRETRLEDLGFDEVELCLSEEEARLEASRCLRCDIQSGSMDHGRE